MEQNENPITTIDDETLVAILNADTDPLASIASVAQAAGLSPEATKLLLHNVRQRYAPVERELRDVKAGQLVRLLENIAFDALTSLTPAELAKASPRDKAIIAGVAIDKRQLLRGEPTAIISMEERKQLGELELELLREIRRRDMVVDDLADEVVVIENDPTPKPRLSPSRPWPEIRRGQAIEKMIETGELEGLTRSVTRASASAGDSKAAAGDSKEPSDGE